MLSFIQAKSVYLVKTMKLMVFMGSCLVAINCKIMRVSAVDLMTPNKLDSKYINLQIEGLEIRSDLKYWGRYSTSFVPGYGTAILIRIKNLGPKDFTRGKILIGEGASYDNRGFTTGPPKEYDLPHIATGQKFAYEYRVSLTSGKISIGVSDILDKEGNRTRLYGVHNLELIPTDASTARAEILVESKNRHYYFGLDCYSPNNRYFQLIQGLVENKKWCHLTGLPFYKMTCNKITDQSSCLELFSCINYN